MLDITNYQGDANQNHMNCHLITVKMDSITKITSASKDMEEREHLNTIDENVIWRCHYGKQCGGSSKTRNRTAM